MAGWHHRLDGHESEQTLGVCDGQGGLVCCDSWGPKELDTTERLNWTELNTDIVQILFLPQRLPWWLRQYKCLSIMRETQIQSLGREDLLEKKMATLSSILAWKIPWTEDWQATVHGVAKSWTQLSDFTFTFIPFWASLGNNQQVFRWHSCLTPTWCSKVHALMIPAILPSGSGLGVCNKAIILRKT